MGIHWRSGQRAQQEWVVSLRRWTPPELSCWVPMQCCTRCSSGKAQWGYIWVDIDNVARGLEKRLGSEKAGAVWARAADWTAGSQELEPSWRVQLGVGADGDLWEVMDLLLERM